MRTSRGTHPLLIQLQELLRDLGGVEGQPQTLDIEFRDDVLENLLQRQATGRPMSRRGWNGILQDGSAECGQLTGKMTSSSSLSQLSFCTVCPTVPPDNVLILGMLSYASEDQIGFISS